MKRFSPHEVVITFDLHGVLFTTDYQLFFKRLWQSPHCFTILMHAFRPTIWYRCMRLWLQASPIEQYIMELTTGWPRLKPCRDTFIALANAQKPQKTIIDLVHALKKQGYELHIFSNIGTTILADLRTPFFTILSLFDHIFTTYAQIGYISKRNDTFFKLYLQSHNSLLFKHVIFIDNCQKNIKAGRDNGMLGIYAHNPVVIIETLKLHLYFQDFV